MNKIEEIKREFEESLSIEVGLATVSGSKESWDGAKKRLWNFIEQKLQEREREAVEGFVEWLFNDPSTSQWIDIGDEESKKCMLEAHLKQKEGE